jgi:hypothetical protein
MNVCPSTNQQQSIPNNKAHRAEDVFVNKLSFATQEHVSQATNEEKPVRTSETATF